MATKAATELALGSLHAQITRVFTKVLSTYEKRLDVMDTIKTEELTDEMLGLLMDADAMPNPAMLAAVTKFLRDNTISFDTQEIDMMSATQERLANRKEKRGDFKKLTQLALVEEPDG